MGGVLLLNRNTCVSFCWLFIVTFTALHGMQRWEFCPSVCLSNVCIVTKRKKAIVYLDC